MAKIETFRVPSNNSSIQTNKYNINMPKLLDLDVNTT